jgi:D-glycero-alpha-D-manno-heptose-7-phosphate kinase
MKVRARAPLRLGLAGGGTDVSPYCDEHGGLVLNATIDKYAYASIESSESGLLEVVSADREMRLSVEPWDSGSLHDGFALHRGVYERMIKQYHNGEPIAVRISTHTDAPPGSGLGSSSTLVVALVTAFAEYLRLPLGQYEIAHLAWEIERVDLGLAGGRQDQYAAAFGGFNFMEFRPDGGVSINPLRVRRWITSELEASLLLYFGGVSRESATIIEQQAANVRAGAESAVDATHALKAEAVNMKDSLLKGNFTGMVESLHSGWVAKQQLADSITNPAIERVHETASRCGMRAGKISGAGGGGFMMMLVDPVRRMDVIRGLAEVGGRVSTCHFTHEGAESWLVA